MFSTILNEVTGYFDRRALISAFFPSLVFWALAIVIILVMKIGLISAINMWDGLTASVQIVLLVTFFVWISFWTFLTLNFRTALVRIFEGYWPDVGISAKIIKWKRGQWHACWDKLDEKDQKLGINESDFFNESESYEELQSKLSKSIENDTNETSETSSGNSKQLNEEFEEFLRKTESSLDGLKTNPLSDKELFELGSIVREKWEKYLPYLKGSKNDKEIWKKYNERLTKITNLLKSIVDRRKGEIEEKRLWLNHELLLYYPPNRFDIMPTRLGNVLKSSEMYSQERYCLDSIVIWPRLQPSLPKDFADPLEDAKTSLDLMVTLSAFILVFGLPLSVYVAANSSAMIFWWIPLIIFLLTIALRFYVAAVFAFVALILTYIPLYIPSLSLTIDRIQIFLSLSAAVLFLAWIAYQNSIEAGVAYGEKIKAAFDLYRWKVLEGLHLKIPKDLKEEQNIWKELCGFLQRGYTPNCKYFQYSLSDGSLKKEE